MRRRWEIPYWSFFEGLSGKSLSSWGYAGGQVNSWAVANGVRVYFEAERLKIQELCNPDGPPPDINVPLDRRDRRVTPPTNDPWNFTSSIREERARLHQAIEDALAGPMELVRRAVERLREDYADNDGEPLQLTRVLMSGQTSRAEQVQSLLRATVTEANGGEEIPIEFIVSAKEAVAQGAIQQHRADIILNRSSRVHVFLKDPLDPAGGWRTFLPVIERFAQLPAELLCCSDPDVNELYFPLEPGMPVRLVESFVDLSDPDEFETAELDADYREFETVYVPGPHEGWTHEDIERAKLHIQLTAEEEIRVGLVRCGEDGCPIPDVEELVFWSSAQSEEDSCPIQQEPCT